MSLPILPQELISDIVDHLHDDPATLRSCAVVCREWLSHSRFHIFHRIVLQPPQPTRSFFTWTRKSAAHLLLRAIQRSPEIASYIRDVDIVEGIGAGEWMINERALVPLLLLMKNVQRFQLRRSAALSINWPALSWEFKSTILHILTSPSLCELNFGMLSFASSEELRRLLGYSKNLQAVSLDHLHIFESSDHLAPAGNDLDTSRVPLDALVLGARTSPLIVGCLLHPQSMLDVASLRHLSISMSDNFGEFARLLRSAVCLESLDLLLMSDSEDYLLKLNFHEHLHAPTVDLVAYQRLPSSERLDLSHNPYIATLSVRIDVIQRQDDPLPWLNGLLSTFTRPNNLRKVHVVYGLYLPSPYMDRSVNTTIFANWQEIDATLTGPVFDSLEKVWLEFSLENPIGFDVAPRFLKEVDLKSPALQSSDRTCNQLSQEKSMSLDSSNLFAAFTAYYLSERCLRTVVSRYFHHPEFRHRLRASRKDTVYFGILLGAFISLFSFPFCSSALWQHVTLPYTRAGSDPGMGLAANICITTRGVLWVSELNRLDMYPSYVYHHLGSIAMVLTAFQLNIPEILLLPFTTLVSEIPGDLVWILAAHQELDSQFLGSTRWARRREKLQSFQIGFPQKFASAEESDNGKPQSRWMPEGGIMKWVTTKAGDTWAGFGKAKGGWKLKVYQGGERLVDRLEFEELALKGIDPSLGPTITQPDVPASGEVTQAVQQEKVTIPLIYPPSINSGPVTLAELRALIAYRTPRHKKGFYLWMIIAPFTAPFMIIREPASTRLEIYLQTLLDNDALVPEASEALDTVYIDYSPDKTTPRDEKSEGGTDRASFTQQHEVLLTRDAVPTILDTFKLKPSSGADLMRAVEQARTV
ncbi:hypothetical protein DXG01_003497 [Tephrocybe rancida]|nr:hypothetical protein DXG01_003497 [Tephrocybe rancida]